MNSRRDNCKPVRSAAKSAPRGKAPGKLRFLLLVAVILILLAAGYNLSLVKEIRVAGTERLERSEVIGACGVKTGSSIFTVREEKVAEQLLSLPGIHSATVTRRFPSTVEIRLIEREPAACILVDGEYWTVDREGVVLDRWANLAESLPVINGFSGEDIFPGKTLGDSGRGEVLAAILQALENVPELELAEFNLVDKHNLVCYTADGLPVLLGGGELMEEKLNLLWHSLPYLAGAGKVAHVDLQTGDRLVVVREE